MDSEINFNRLDALLMEYAQAVESKYKSNLIAEGKRATGDLIRSIKSKVTFGGGKYEVTLQLAKYWYYIEHGRKAGKFPPKNAILKWIQVKPIIPRPYNGKLPTNDQLAYLIGRKIATQGIDATPILQTTLDALNGHYLPLLTEALGKDIEDNMFGILNAFKV